MTQFKKISNDDNVCANNSNSLGLGYPRKHFLHRGNLRTSKTSNNVPISFSISTNKARWEIEKDMGMICES